MSTPFHTHRRVEFHETDMAGIVHFSNYFRWMESAEVDFLHARGLSVRLGWDGQQLGCGYPRRAKDWRRALRRDGDRIHQRNF